MGLRECMGLAGLDKRAHLCAAEALDRSAGYSLPDDPIRCFGKRFRLGRVPSHKYLVAEIAGLTRLNPM